MTKDEILKLAECSAEELNANKVDTNSDFWGYILFETPFLQNWINQNILNFVPCRENIISFSKPITIIDTEKYPADYTSTQIFKCMKGKEKELCYTMARDLIKNFTFDYPFITYLHVDEIAEMIGDYIGLIHV